MLREIHIQNYAVIDSLTVQFGPGLNLLSGETGSGKSIVVDALGLALGGVLLPTSSAPGMTARWSLPRSTPGPAPRGLIGWRSTAWRRARTET